MRITGTILMFALITLSACSSSSKTQSSPSPVDPTANNPQDVTPTNPSTSGLPDLSRAGVLSLTDTTTYSGLYDITRGDFYPVSTTGSQIVGNAKIQLSINNSTRPKGNVIIAFEDRKGFWGKQLNSFSDTSGTEASVRSGVNYALFFASDDFVVRVDASSPDSNVYGNVYYRMRQSGDTQCKRTIVTCGYGCSYPSPNDIAICQNYMDTSQTSVVKKLGTFTVPYTNIVVN